MLSSDSERQSIDSGHDEGGYYCIVYFRMVSLQTSHGFPRMIKKNCLDQTDDLPDVAHVGLD